MKVTITLDLDGVLMQNPFGTYVIPRVLQHLEGSAKLSHLAREDAHQALRQAVTQEYQARMDRRDFVAAYHWDDIYQTVGRAQGIHDLPDVTALVNEGVAAGHVHALPGAHEALQLLRDAGFRTLALTNGYRKYQWPVLEGIGLAPLLDGLESPEAHGYAKPQPELFHAAGQVLAHVGDTLEHDILGANLAGVKAVWIVPELPGEQMAVSGAELTSPALTPFFDEMKSKSIYLKHHPEATPELLTPWVAVRNVLDGAGVIVQNLRP